MSSAASFRASGATIDYTSGYPATPLPMIVPTALRPRRETSRLGRQLSEAEQERITEQLACFCRFDPPHSTIAPLSLRWLSNGLELWRNCLRTSSCRSESRFIWQYIVYRVMHIRDGGGRGLIGQWMHCRWYRVSFQEYYIGPIF